MMVSIDRRCATGFTMTNYQLPDLSFDYGDLQPHISARIMELHHDKHHRAYVENANVISEKYASAIEKEDFSSIGSLQRSLAFNLSGHFLHSLFWNNLSPSGGGAPTGTLQEAIEKDFGNFERFQKVMTQTIGQVQGSGWACLAWESETGCLKVEQLLNHQDNVILGSTPLLVIDAWEHAYYLQYENRRNDYVGAIWNVINWDDVASRFKKVTTDN